VGCEAASGMGWSYRSEVLLRCPLPCGADQISFPGGREIDTAASGGLRVADLSR